MNIEYIKSQIENGYTLKRLSTELNCGYSTLRKFCRENGIKSLNIKINSKYPEKVLRKLIKESISYTELFKKLNVTQSGGSYQRVQERIKYFKIDVSHFNGKKEAIKKLNNWNGDIVIKMDRRETRKRLLKLIGDKIPYKCVTCGIKEWQGTELILHIDHIDENRCNNVIENLQFLCPNCHNIKTYTKQFMSRSNNG